MAARLKEQYFKAILPELKQQFGHTNDLQVPRLNKIVVNMGVGDAISDPRNMDTAMAELAVITGQKPSVRKSRKSISNFKLRAGVNIGCMVTLRGERMYEFVDRLFNIAIPRIRDFRGLSPKGFDQFGNYTLGLREQTIFPEVKVDDVNRTRGMNITFVIKNSHSADESRELLRKLGMPFAG
ncbi:MAG: 50S ribosomal protein L5 [Candidatus Hydrogenedentes bacterium]|nr:50S ribosomal protein L5 [Candidatus Hydrogenedentota bacterium]MBI3118035.1 50S ribosomal protein L5 [Candidatus Hydrogenedentota bacterium]